MYSIEFQKRGLLHAHLLIFLHPSSKYPTALDIDKVISAEIPCAKKEPQLYACVKEHMMHGPCGLSNRSSPCMKNGSCSRFYPKKYQNTTTIAEDGFPHYRRRSNDITVVKNDIELDNRFVVPYNPTILVKYQAHVNVEWCNRSNSIKYLFKYINKGYDRITTAIVSNGNDENVPQVAIDEIKQYIDCRYISPCEACWRIFSFPIHGRNPAVERLFFHLPGEQSVYFKDDDDIDEIIAKPTVKESMFTTWMDCNTKYSDARDLTYPQFVSKYVYNKNQRCWKPRQKGNTIGRLIWVPPATGELFYLRRMLTIVKGPQSYVDLRIVDNIIYSTFREACEACGFLAEDTEYVDAIKEAKDWGSGHFLRKLFVTILMSNSVLKPEELWSKTWEWLSDGILYNERMVARNQGTMN